MGVPRLFRLLTERYPLLTADCSTDKKAFSGHTGAVIPQIDNFYLDFNGIIHTETHGDGIDPDLPEEDAFAGICATLEALVSHVQPRKLLYVAVDGVAPRAKANQQRARRFRSAMGRDDEATTFDSNCITPGTEFMQRLETFLVYFIQRKITEDPLWSKLDVILSGHRVPGEGEHKIVEFIRGMKIQPGYNPNTSHCLYGLDADLIILALATHEPHFIILREKVIVRRKSKLQSSRKALQRTRDFQMIQIGLLREYIMMEFRLSLHQDTAQRAYVPPNPDAGPPTEEDKAKQAAEAEEAERLIDDFVFMSFLLGNDFLPHLPTADLENDGLKQIFEVYRQARDITGGSYLVNAQKCSINPKFLEFVMKLFSMRESKFYEHSQKLHEILHQSMRMRQQRATQEERDAPVSSSQEQNNLGTTAAGSQTDAPQDHLKSLLSQMSVTADKTDAETSRAAEAKSADKPTDSSPGSNQTAASNPSRSKLLQFFHPSEIASGRPAATPAAILRSAKRAAAALAGAKPATENTEGSTGETGTSDDEPPASGAQSADSDTKKSRRDEPKGDQNKDAEEGNEDDEDEDGDEEEEQADLIMEKFIETEPVVDSDSYYRVKLWGYKDSNTSERRRAVCKAYLEGLVWTLNYYYRGVPSWTWFYPYLATPLPSDMADLPELYGSLRLEVGKPFSPFEQLLAVLPAASRKLLPTCLRSLMVEELSEMYPREFSFIPDPHGRDWRDIALIPFVDAQKLAQEVGKKMDTAQLTEEERDRNTFGLSSIFKFCNTTVNNPSPFSDRFASTKAKCTSKPFSPWPLSKEGLKPQPPAGCWYNKVPPPPSFPSTKFLNTTQSLQTIPLRVFGRECQVESLVLHLIPPNLGQKGQVQEQAIMRIAQSVVGKVRNVGYPTMLIGKVIALHDANGVWRVTRKGKLQRGSHTKPWDDVRTIACRSFLSYKGIDVGPTAVVVEVEPLDHMATTLQGGKKSSFSSRTIFLPLQAVPAITPRPDPRFAEAAADPPEKRFSKGSQAVYLGSDSYGIACKVTKLAKEEGEPCMSVEFVHHASRTKRQEVTLLEQASLIARRDQEERYMHGREVAERIGINGLALSRVCGTITLVLGEETLDIGLGVKFSRRALRVPGYARTTQDGKWLYSESCLKLLQQLKNEFPDFLRGLDAHAKMDEYSPEDLFQEEDGQPMTNANERATALVKWFASSPTADLQLVPVDSVTLNRSAVSACEALFQQLNTTQGQQGHGGKVDKSRDNVRPKHLVAPLQLPLQEAVRVDVGDVVINACDVGQVPFGLTGIVVGLRGQEAEVVFEKPFFGGSTLGGRCKTYCGAVVSTWTLLSRTSRTFVQEAPASTKERSDRSKAKGSQAGNANPFAALMS